MTKLKTTCVAACIAASFIMVGCTGNKQVSSSLSSSHARRESRFIEDISLGGNNSNINMTVGGQKYSATTTTRRRAGNSTADQHTQQIPRYVYSREEATSLKYKYADMLQVVPSIITNIDLYSFIEDWYGVRYRLGGNDKSGIDCSAFVQRLYENVFGTNLVRTAFEQFNTCAMVFKSKEMKEGDLVFFTTSYRHRRKTYRRISHVGIYLTNDYFVHASSSNGVMISSLKETYWANKFAGAGQIPRG